MWKRNSNDSGVQKVLPEESPMWKHISPLWAKTQFMPMWPASMEETLNSSSGIEARKRNQELQEVLLMAELSLMNARKVLLIGGFLVIGRRTSLSLGNGVQEPY